MKNVAVASQGRNSLRRLFPLGFFVACLLFWWLPSILFRSVGLEDPIEAWTLRVSASALGIFLAGYFLPARMGSRQVVSQGTIDLCERFSYSATKAVAIPAFIVGLNFAVYRAGMVYGEGNDIPLLTQAILYSHMFVAYMFIATVPDCEGANRRRVLIVSTLVILPRLFISLHWGRFFVGQTIVSILFLLLARGWIRVSFKRVVQLSLLALMILFVPSLTRGDPIGGNDARGIPRWLDYFQAGSTLQFFQNDRRAIHWDCPPLLVSMTAKIIPYTALHVCTMDVGETHNVIATLDHLLTRRNSNDLGSGAGSNYLLELYLTGGLPAIFIGSFLFGAISRRLVESMAYRSLFAGIWAECLVRALFAPRGNLGYVFERIPSLLLATLAVVVLCRWANILRHSPLPSRLAA